MRNVRSAVVIRGTVNREGSGSALVTRASVNPCDKDGSDWTILNKCRKKGEFHRP